MGGLAWCCGRCAWQRLGRSGCWWLGGGVGCGRAGGNHVGQGFGHVDEHEVVLAGEDGFAGFDAGGGCKIGRDAPAQGGEGIAHGAAELQGGAFGVGLAFVAWPALERFAEPYFSALNAMPRIALAPLFILWFGLGPGSKIAVGFSVVFFVVVSSTVAG